VAQEALTNVERHSRARKVELTLDSDSKHLRLSLRDDGTGLDASGPLRKGIGLRNMRERVEHHGGTLEVCQGSDVGGTLLVVQVPLAAAMEESSA
jgi:two-component system NarL family sensor kinase